MAGSASAALATSVIAAYLATGSSISTRSIFQPCGTNTPNFVDRGMLSPSFSNNRIADAKGRAMDDHVRTSNTARAFSRFLAMPHGLLAGTRPSCRHALYPSMAATRRSRPMGSAIERESPVLLPAVPITTDETEPHVLIEEGTGLEVRFAVAAGTVITIEVTNPAERTGHSRFAQA